MKNTNMRNPSRSSHIQHIEFSKVLNGFFLQQPKLFESFMENSPALAWISDENCTIYYMNRSYRETFDLGEENLMKQPNIFPEEFLNLYIANNRKVIEENQALNTIEDGYDQHGRYRIFKVCKFPLGIHGHISLVGACMIDITTELTAEKELQRTNERYRFAMKAISDVVWEWDLTAGTMFMSEGYEALFGYKSTCSVEALQSHVHPEDVREVTNSLLSAVKSGEQYWQMEYRYLCKDGSIKTVLNKAFAVRDESGKPIRVIGALQDMTGIKQLQQKLVTEQESRKRQVVSAVMQAQEKERNEIGRELHDNVNQLLATAKLLIESAQVSPQKAAGFLQRSITMINCALDENRNLSHRLIQPSLEPRDFYESVKGIASLLDITNHIRVSINLPSLNELEEATGELRLTIYRIVQEQLANIMKYAKANQVVVSLTKTKNNWELKIKDDGIGFNPDCKGKGVGLKNIRSRIENLNGTFQLRSSEGEGCGIFITIPADF